VSPAGLDALTARERQIVDAVRLGYRNKLFSGPP